MAPPLVSVARWLFALALGSTLATACVRSEPPAAFICASPDDCEEGEVCRSGKCVPSGSCSSEYDCDSHRQICRANQCVNVACTSYNEEVCAGYACEDDTNVCKTSCAMDYDCARGAYCDQAKCVLGSRPQANDATCTENRQCQSGICCARGSGSVCSARCEPSGAACQTAKDCKDNFCCAQFNAESLCSSRACLLTTCSADSECGVDQYCSASARCESRQADGARCARAGECLSASCLANVCRGDGSAGDSCEESYECTVGRMCCAINGSGRRCYAEGTNCLAEVGYSCEYDSECADGKCKDYSHCTKQCQTSADCGVGPFGVPNVCVGGNATKYCYAGCTTTSQCEGAFDYTVVCSMSSGSGYCSLF